MEMKGEQRIAASRDEVWRALNDLDVLRECIPGCTELVSTGDNQMKARITISLGSIKANFASKMTLSEISYPNGYVLSGKGQGGPAGFAEGKVSIELDEDGHGTLLRYTGQVRIGGKIAQLGSRLIDATSRKYIGQFFASLSTRLSPAPAETVQSGKASGLFARLVRALRSLFGKGN